MVGGNCTPSFHRRKRRVRLTTAMESLVLLYLVLDHGSPYPRLDLENKSLPQWFNKVGTDIVNLANDSFRTRWNLIRIL